MPTFDFCIEAPGGRDLWGTVTAPQRPQGPPVVMAHGFLGFKDWAFFPWLAETFAREGFPAVRFNFSGSGMGPEADGPFRQLEAFQADTISRQVEDLHRVLRAVTGGQFAREGLAGGDSALLWGHSRGGAVCLLGAVNRPEVKGVSTWASISRVNRYFYEDKKAWRERGFFPVESARTGQQLRYSPDFLDDVERWGKAGDVPTHLHHLTVPVLLVHGSEDDSVPPEESESLAALYPQSRLAILAGANHKFNASHPFAEAAPVLREAAQRTVEFYRTLG
ncbi:MAG TPA: alpha/beta fold hydrolase [bacterium]|nr:alpha/beta fold hydrolase [bacterium]